MPKQKNTTELRDELAQLKSESQKILSEVRASGKMLDASQEKRLGEIQCRQVEIRAELNDLDVQNQQKGKPYEKKGESFSLRRAILAASKHQEQRDTEAAVIEQAAAMHRASGIPCDTCGDLVIPFAQKRAAYTAATEAATGVVIDEDQMELLFPLQPALVLSKAGTRILTGLRGNIYWPKYSGVSVSWESETAKAKDAGGAFSKGKVFSPKRLTAKVNISKQLLLQENMSVETIIRQQLAIAIAQKIEQTVFGNHPHADTMPDGFFKETPTAITGDMTWARIVDFETTADLNNALFGNTAYILHPSLVGKAKTKVKDASGAGGFVFDATGNGMLNGYKALRTNNMPKGLQDGADEFGIIFGNWADFFLGQWGAIDMTVDPFTQAEDGQIKIVVNSYWDMGPVRDESFVIGSLK